MSEKRGRVLLCDQLEGTLRAVPQLGITEVRGGGVSHATLELYPLTVLVAANGVDSERQ